MNNTKKIKILVFVTYYIPGCKSGGPARTISNMVDQLGDNLEFYIITTDRDIGDSNPYPNIIIDSWNSVGKAKVFYTSSRGRSIGNLIRLIRNTPFDILYLNGFFDPVFTILPLCFLRLGVIQKRPAIIAPRGQFSLSALNIKRWKKRIYIGFVKLIGLYRDLVWQASSKHEALDINRTLGHVAKRIIVAPDVPATIDDKFFCKAPRRREPGALFRVCFLSRIVPVKNLDYALQVMAKVKEPVVFNIFGTVEDERYWQLCQQLLEKMPGNVQVNYYGAVDHKDVIYTLAQQDLFFLPTKGENYGHVIFEALSAGVPILISDKTPWRNLKELGVGWDISLEEPEKFITIIENQAKIDEIALNEQQCRIKEYATAISSDNNVLKKNLFLFKDALQ